MAHTGSSTNATHGDRLVVFDAHTHLFSPSVIDSVSKRDGLAEALCLRVDEARSRTDKAALKRESIDAGVTSCLLLPTAPFNGVRKVNDFFLSAAAGETDLFTAGTLHPRFTGVKEEPERLSAAGVRAIKLSSFSQGFDLLAEETLRMFSSIRAHNVSGKPRFFVILDTFYKADRYFKSPGEFLTTPAKLGRLAADFPEIDFIGAHMGGLAAPFTEIEKHLTPKDNLYLDTSNAAHVLSRQEFLRLLALHGPDRIIFGTDWPWFGHQQEIALIQGLLQESGFSTDEQARVFSRNISRLLELPGQ